MFCGVAGAVIYDTDSGINNITSANCSYWSTVLSNNDSTVQSTSINVNDGAVLNLVNATIRMRGNGINVNFNGTMNVTGGSTITRYSNYYDFKYFDGSFGYVSDSTIEYSNKLQIDTSNNLKIVNSIIRNNRYEGISLTSTSGNVNLTNNAITNNGPIGINIASSGNNILRDNNINGTSRSLYVSGNYTNDIDASNKVNGDLVYYKYNINGVLIVGENIGHITLYNCSNVSIKDNTFVTDGDGIRLVSSTENVTIDNNIFSNSNYYGIALASSQANITNNIVTNSDETAILLSVSHNSNMMNNIMSGGTDIASGIKLSNSNNNVLVNNTVTATGSDVDGILVSSSNSNNLIENILIYSGSSNGIRLYDADSNNLINNSVKNKGKSGFSLDGGSNYNTIRDNDITNNAWGGITIDAGSHNNISNNEILSNDGGDVYDPRNGVTILSGTNNSVNNNNISLNTLNGTMVNSTGNRISNNILFNNGDNGISIQADGNTFSNNTIIMGATAGYGFDIKFGQYSNYIYQNNTVNGEKIYYYFNDNTMQSVTVEPLTTANVSNVGKISLIQCSNFRIDDNILSNNKYIDGGIPSGIFLYDSTDNTISNNDVMNNYQGIYLYNSSNNVISNLNSINTSEDRGIYLDISNYNEITNNIFGSNVISGIYFNFSNYNNIIGNNVTGSSEGILLETSLNNSLSINNITNYLLSAIRLIEYSMNNTIIGNVHSIRNSAEFDICINDSNNNVIAPNETTATNYTFYLTGDTRLVTLDTVFNKTNVGYEDTSGITLMWRIDVFSWDNKHIEPIWGNLTVRYGDYSAVGGILVWDGQVPNANGRLSNNSMDYWGPPNSDDNWLPIIEYKENATGKVNYQSTPMNFSVVNMWDKLQSIDDKLYRNITTTIHNPGVTIIINAGYTPNGKCYYCHMEKLTYTTMVHWTDYTKNLTDMTDPHTPGRCIDCHDENDSVSTPHGIGSGNDMLIQQSPQLCYNGSGNQNCHNTDTYRATLDQETEFNQITHHDLGDGKMTCFSCHGNHGTDYRFDLHRNYVDVDRKLYDSADYALCFVCHLEEKLKASMTDTGYLGSFNNQTNFRDEYYSRIGFDDQYLQITRRNQNLHSGHARATCKYCHNPHGSNNPAVTRPSLDWAYITNITAPGSLYPHGDYTNQIILDDPADWGNSTLNQAGGLQQKNCGGCHWKLPIHFVYREFIDYESAGGPDCVGCHDSSDPDAIRKILNVSALKLAMHTNLSLDFRNGGELQGTGMNWTEWGTERGYNASNISTDNAICWSCHSTNGTPPYPGFHPDRTLAPYRCPKCHGPVSGQPPHTDGLVAAIDNHGPTTKGSGSIYIQTNVGTNGSCADCHGPSKLPDSAIGVLTVWKYTGGFQNFTGRTTTGDVAHYGLSRSQGEDYGIANPLVNTSDCLFCHANSLNGAIWGNAMNVSGNMYGADTTNISECYTYCHVLPDYIGIVNENSIAHFHNSSVYSGGGPNCVDCHDVNSAYHIQSLVNVTSIAQSIHGNMGNNTIELVPGIDPRSKPCWGCHQSDGHEPEGMGDRNGVSDPSMKPWTCEDCHGRSSEWVAATHDGDSWLAASYPPNKLPPRIYAHYSNSSTVKTNISRAGGCVDCHVNSIDPYYNDTSEMVLGNTIFSNVSHYGLSRSQGEVIGVTNPLFDTSNCGICHNSTQNATIWGNATQNEHGDFTDYFADDGCYICHTTDGQAPVDFHVGNLSSDATGPDCLYCHRSAGINKFINFTLFNDSIHINLNSEATNSTILVYNSSKACWSCHGNGTQPDIHLSNLTAVRTCYDNVYCHGNTTLNQSVSVEEHFINGIDIQATNATDNAGSCIQCHNLTEMKVSGAPTDKNGTHLVSHYGKNYTIISQYRNNINSTDYCLACHGNSNSIFHNASIITKTTTHGDNCSSCHGAGNIHDASLEVPSISGDSSECLGCHDGLTNKRVISNEYTVSVHSAVNCADCHTPRQEFKGIIVNQESLAYNFTMIPDITSLNATLVWEGGSTLGLTLHSPNGTNYSGNSINISSPQAGNWSAVVRDITGDAPFTLTINVTMKHGIMMAKDCDDCHITGFGITPLVYKHLPQQSNVPTDASCILCHESKLSSATAMGSSHYAPRVTLDTKDCIQCHNGSVDGWGNAPDQRNNTDFAFVTKTLSVDKPWELVDNYTITLIETTTNAAMFEIKKDGILVQKDVTGLGGNIKYEVSGLGIDDTAIINVTVDQLFTAENSYVADLSGYMLSSHIHRETQNEQCYSCHDSEYRNNMPDGMNYYVLDKDCENVTLMEMTVNFTDGDKKIIAMGEWWDLGEGFSVCVADVSIEGSNARLQLYRNETLLEDEIVSTSDYVTHEETLLDRDINVFSAKVDSVFVGDSKFKFVVLTNVDLIAGDQKVVDGDFKLLQTAISAKYLTLDGSITVGEELENFHSATVTPGGYSPDCISCHAGNGVAPILLDLDEFKQGVHVNLNNNTTYTSFITDDANKACWGCHGNSTGGEPDEHPTPYLGNHTPKSCMTCHASSKFGAKPIYSHYPGAEISTSGTCWDCHSNKQNSSKPQNEIAAASHYSAKKNLLNTSDCAVCHGDETNATLWGNAPQVSKHNSSNDCELCHAGEGITTFHDKGITITRDCETCHVDKQQAEKFNLTPILTHYPGAPDGKANTLEINDYTCRVCHNATNNTLHSGMEVREYQNESLGFCFPCHSTEGKYPHKSDTQLEEVLHGSGIKVVVGCDSCHAAEGVSKYHTPSVLGKSYLRGTVKYDTKCTECHPEHEGREYQPYEGIKCEDCHNEYGSVHYAGLKIGQSNTTTSTCPLCHNEDADIFHELTHIVSNVSVEAYEPCGDCHDDTDALMEFSSSSSIIGGTMSTISQSALNESPITCTSCHNSSGMNSFHYDTYPMGTVQDPGWKNWTGGNVTGCKDCHTYQGGEPPFNATNMGTQGISPAGTAHGFAPSCTICHGGADPISFHILATSEFIPRLAVTIEPNVVYGGDVSLLQATVVLPQLTKLTRAEYFIDEISRDGYGLPLEYIVGKSNDSSAVLGAAINTSQLSYDKHPIFVHVKDSSGKWSKTEVVVLTVERAGGIAAMEVLLKDIIPAFGFAGLLFLIWRRFR